jgi:regulator of vacuolar morphogenesis
MSDASGSRQAGVEAKRLLRDLGPRVDRLEKELSDLKSGLGEGEKRRREEMVENLRAERGSLTRMAEVGMRAGGGSGFNRGSPSSDNDHSPSTSALFGPSHHTAAPGRVFGQKAPPQETEETRPLDDRGVLQLQQTKMGDQDAQLGELSKVLQRQRKMGEEIHHEIGEQNELLDDLETGVDKTGGKLGKAKREMNRLK